MKTVMLMIRGVGLWLVLCALAVPFSANARGNRAITFMQKGGWVTAIWYQNDGGCLYLVGSISSFENTTRMFGYVNPYAVSYVSVEVYDICTQAFSRYSAVDSVELTLGAAGALHARVSGVVPANVCTTVPNRPIDCRDAQLAVDLRWDAYGDPVRMIDGSHDYENGIGMFSFQFTGSFARAEVTGHVMDGDIPLFLAPVRSGEIRDSRSNSVTIYPNN